MVKSAKNLRTVMGGKTSSVLVTRSEVRAMIRSSALARMEMKRFSEVVASYAGTVAGDISPLSQGLVIGDTISSRTGDTIFPHKLELNLSLIGSGAAITSAPLIVRTLIFQDMLNVGSTPTVAQVLDGGVFNSSYALLTNQQKRFRILYDKNTSLVVGASNFASMYELKFKLKGKIFYNGDTNAATANGPGSMWILTIVSAAAGVGVGISFYSSFLFTDA